MTVPILQEQRGAQRLAELLDRSFVRNAPEQIKRAYTLPPLTSSVKYLDFLEGERKTYNSLLAVFAVNSIQSQRIDVRPLSDQAVPPKLTLATIHSKTTSSSHRTAVSLTS